MRADDASTDEVPYSGPDCASYTPPHIESDEVPYAIADFIPYSCTLQPPSCTPCIIFATLPDALHT